jgi:hypothetical protein
MLDQQNFPTNIDFAQHSSAFPPDFQPPPNPLLVHPQAGVMSQLDRQMVLSSYAGLDHIANTNPMLDGGTGNIDFDFHAMASNAGNGNGNGNNYWGDPSTAWFMPFNMEPPTMVEDTNLFNTGGFDWGNTFGDFGNLPPTGMTPRPAMELDSGQEMQGDGNAMEGMGGMQQL